jgi:hypothetical protein
VSGCETEGRNSSTVDDGTSRAVKKEKKEKKIKTSQQEPISWVQKHEAPSTELHLAGWVHKLYQGPFILLWHSQTPGHLISPSKNLSS